jgi:hypothetical protein
MRSLLLIPAPLALGGCATATDLMNTANQAAGAARSTGLAPVQAYWNTAADEANGPVGATVTFVCPPDGTAGRVWGTDTYTSDTSVCTAGVHMGLITFARGGSVTIQFRPGQRNYSGSRRNGVESGVYGEWGKSFIFVR